MPMNKKELQEMANLKLELEKAKAFRFTDRVKKDVPIPQYGEGISRGYVFNTYTKTTSIACSGTTSHGVGSSEKTSSQNPISMYSTHLLALRALRNALEDEYSLTLAMIDSEIAKEQSSRESDNA